MIATHHFPDVKKVLAFFALGVVLAFFALAFVLWRSAMGAGPDVDPPPQQPVMHRGVDLTRVVVWTEAAGGYPTARGFDPILLDGGWKTFVRDRIQPEVDWLAAKGVQRPRVLLHNPYGLERDAAGNVNAGQTGDCRRS